MILKGDWCGFVCRHHLSENRGVEKIRRAEQTEVICTPQKKSKKVVHRRSLPLDRNRLNGDPIAFDT